MVEAKLASASKYGQGISPAGSQYDAPRNALPTVAAFIEDVAVIQSLNLARGFGECNFQFELLSLALGAFRGRVFDSGLRVLMRNFTIYCTSLYWC